MDLKLGVRFPPDFQSPSSGEVYVGCGNVLEVAYTTMIRTFSIIMSSTVRLGLREQPRDEKVGRLYIFIYFNLLLQLISTY